jgi:hypothetical protein
MKTLLIPILFLVGCAAPHGVAPSTLKATQSIQSASVGAVRAQASAARAKASVSTSKEAISILEKSATAHQRPAVQAIKHGLQVANMELAQTEAHLMTVSNSLTATDGQLQRLQLEVDDQAAKLTIAERRAAAYHRLKFWLAAAAAGFAFYAATRIIPPLGPYKWWIASGIAAVAGGIAFVMI